MISWTDLLTRKNLSLQPQRDSLISQRPQVVVWNITSDCNLSCRHCYDASRQTPNTPELNQKQAKDFIQDLSQIKVPALLFSGGEPLLRKDIFALAKFAKNKGIKVALSTNGTLITPEVARKIKKAGFFYVGISLDGREKTNDWFRKKPGAFRKTLSGIRNCQKVGLKVGLRFTLTKYNFKDLPHIFALIEKENIRRLCLYHLVYTGRGSELKDKDLNFAEKRRVLEFIWQKTLDFKQKGLKCEILTVDNHADGVWIYLKLKKTKTTQAKRAWDFLKYQGGNSAGIKMVGVDSRGEVFPDQFWRTHSLGNLREKKFSQIWQDKNNKFLLALRNRIPLFKGRCSRCNYVSLCNGNFRVRAETVFADRWAEDPACYLTDKEIERECSQIYS